MLESRERVPLAEGRPVLRVKGYGQIAVANGQRYIAGGFVGFTVIGSADVGGGIITSTLVASLSVAPFGIYHFHNTQQFAVLANLVAIPIQPTE
jgi:hypothetical protein